MIGPLIVKKSTFWLRPWVVGIGMHSRVFYDKVMSEHRDVLKKQTRSCFLRLRISIFLA